MYTVVENARIVISLLKKHNIKHIVLSPGGSNIPIVQGVQDDPFFKCYSVVDERSAMYVAIGIYLQTGEIVATSCTSAQATRNYLPGLTEAFYKHIPILAITMSKHPKYLGQEYMQCPIQTSLPIDAVKKSYSLPRISTNDDRILCIRTVNEAILELTHNGNGPVQLNIEALDSETWKVDETMELPDVRVINRYCSADDIQDIKLNGRKTMLLIGEHRPFSLEEFRTIESFCESNNCFVYTTHISNYCGKYSLNAVPILVGSTHDYYVKALRPEVVITIGGTTGDYDLLNMLTSDNNGNLEVWRVNIDGNVVDTYGKLTKVFQMNYTTFFDKLSQVIDHRNHEYYNNWLNGKNQMAIESVELPFSNIAIAQRLHLKVPANSYLNFAILNSFRSWLYFDIDSTIKSFCNVAAFGIDGCLSTMIGQSFTTDNLCFLVTGDLSFYYDMNAIALRQIRNNVRIILVNNNGGAEFKLNTIHLQTDVSRYIAADNHFKDARAWTEANGFMYLRATNISELDKISDIFFANSERPIVMEVFTEADNERKALGIARDACLNGFEDEIRKKELIGAAKNVVKNALGDTGIKAIRKIIGK